MRYVPFVCNHNAGRSQMAQAFFERHAPEEGHPRGIGRLTTGVGLGGDDGLRRRVPVRADHGRGVGYHGPGGPRAGAAAPDRDAIDARVRELVEVKIDAIRSDPTAHRFRPPQLLPKLADEFESTRSPEEIWACSDAILSRYDDDPIRSYTQVLAHRRARECLRKDTCDALVGV